jgi:hypothetical protein
MLAARRKRPNAASSGCLDEAGEAWPGSCLKLINALSPNYPGYDAFLIAGSDKVKFRKVP